MKNFIPFILSFLIFSCTKSYNPAVVSARQEASEIGLEIMKNGGNAYDAMIATHLALAVVHPTAGNMEVVVSLFIMISQVNPVLLILEKWLQGMHLKICILIKMEM